MNIVTEPWKHHYRVRNISARYANTQCLSERKSSNYRKYLSMKYQNSTICNISKCQWLILWWRGTRDTTIHYCNIISNTAMSVMPLMIFHRRDSFGDQPLAPLPLRNEVTAAAVLIILYENIVSLACGGYRAESQPSMLCRPISAIPTARPADGFVGPIFDMRLLGSSARCGIVSIVPFILLVLRHDMPSPSIVSMTRSINMPELIVPYKLGIAYSHLQRPETLTIIISWAWWDR